MPSAAEMVSFDVHASDVDDREYKWTCKVPWHTTLKECRKMWAELFDIPGDVVRFEDMGRSALDLNKTPRQLGFTDTGAKVFAVPADDSWSEEGPAKTPAVTKAVVATQPRVELGKKVKTIAKEAVPAPAAAKAKATPKAAPPAGAKRKVDAAAEASKAKRPAVASAASSAADTGPVPEGADKITFKQVNPKRAGTSSYDRYEKYKTAKTAAEALSLGAAKGDLVNDWKRGFFKRAT